MTTVEINGLKDMIACNTRISSIIDDHLSYSGYDISEFMDNKASFEEVIYLLWNGHLPTQMELKYFEAELRKNYDISDAVEGQLSKLAVLLEKANPVVEKASKVVEEEQPKNRFGRVRFGGQ